MTRPEQLASATFVPGSMRLALLFSDGLHVLLPVKSLGMPTDRIKWKTARVTDAGNAMTVNAIKGEVIPIDSSTLRYLTDRKYAARIDEALAKVKLGDEELKELAADSQPPQEWYDQPEDLRLESWK